MPLKNTWIAGESYTAADQNAVATDVNTNTTAVAGKEAAIGAGTAAQYWRGDKSWQTLDKVAAGLGNVDNASNATERAAAATLTNKTLDNTNTVTVKDANLTIQDDGNPTKQAKFEAAGITAGQTRIFTLPDASTNVVGHDTTQTLDNKTLTNPTVNNYTEGVVALGTVTTASTLSLTTGTVQTATLTASTACTFTMPTATAGKSFVLLLKQAAATGNGTAVFTGVKWPTAGAPTITAAAGKMDILSFISDGASWYGSYIQGFTP